MGTCNQQQISIRELISDYTKKNFSDCFLKTFPLNDLKRISENTNLQDYMLAYTDNYQKEHNSVITYNKIVTSIDFLNYKLEELYEYLENNYKQYSSKVKKMDFHLGKSYEMIQKMLFEFQKNQDPAIIELIKLMNFFSENIPNNLADVDAMNELRFLPIDNFCSAVMKQKQSAPPEILNLMLNNSESIRHYNDLSSVKKTTILILKEDLEFILRSIVVLRDSSEMLRKDYL